MSLLIRPAAWVPFPRNPCGRVAYSLSRRQRGKAALPARRATDRARPRYPALFSSADFVCPCSCLHGPTGAGKLSSRHPRAKPAGLAPRRPGPCAPLREHAADVLQIDQRIAALVRAGDAAIQIVPSPLEQGELPWVRLLRVSYLCCYAESLRIPFAGLSPFPHDRLSNFKKPRLSTD